MQRMSVLALMVSASARFIFQSPPGWQHVGTVAGGLGTWLHQGDPVYSQNVSAQATPFSGKLSEIVSKEITYIQGTFADVTMKSIERTTICGKHPATYITYTFVTANGTQVVAEQIVTIYGSTAFNAKYNRAADQEPEESARHSLRTLCGGNPPSGK